VAALRSIDAFLDESRRLEFPLGSQQNCLRIFGIGSSFQKRAPEGLCVLECCELTEAVARCIATRHGDWRVRG
jgi:hypothetical protein